MVLLLIMNKKPRLVDDFIPSNNRPRVTLSDTTNARSIKVVRRNMDGVPEMHVAPRSNFRSETSYDDIADIDNSPNNLNSDIEESLSDLNIDEEEDTKVRIKRIDDDGQIIEKPKRRELREDRRRNRPKQKSKVRKILKWLSTLLLISIIAAIAYFSYKILWASSNIFKGNPLDMFTSKVRLDQDARGRTNILIFGTSGYSMNESAWDGAFLTDSIMIASIDQEKHNAYLISLPRDLYVKRTCSAIDKSTAGKLNEVFHCGYSANKREENGAQNLSRHIAKMLDIDIHYYIHADWTALIKAVDAVGGVDIKIDSKDPRGIYDSLTKLKYKNGEIAHLNGEKALALARARNHNAGDYGLAGGNYDREKNQQKILIALQKKALSLGTILNPVAVNGLLDSMGNNLITSFKTNQVQTLVDIANNIKPEQIKQLPFVGREDQGPDLVATYTEDGKYKGEKPTAGLYNYSDIRNYLKKHLYGQGGNENTAKADPKAATVDVLNGSEQNGLAARKAKQLKQQGWIVGNIDNSPVKTSKAVTIYQLTANGKSAAEELAKQYNTSIESGKLSGYQSQADVAIVFGE